MTRPTLGEIRRYRAAVDRAMLEFLEGAGDGLSPAVASVIELGLNHEQQHQELILTDIKHALGQNPLHPAYREGVAAPSGSKLTPMGWRSFEAGLRWVGHDAHDFAFDNEGPRHRVYLEDFSIATRLVTNVEFISFIEDDGYRRPELWLSDGWNVVQTQQWEAPFYWERVGAKWWTQTLGGFHEVSEAEPICHVSYYEADAFARWAGARLPTEAEWESVAANREIKGNFLENEHYHPRPADGGTEFAQCFGDVWEWTQSPYTPYPGSKPVEGALGEYNAKFMCNQFVLRGGSCATPVSHIRATYRNFFPPEARWQFTGIRLAKDPR
jgi:ergothioneine biosynthesis protein EgtB